jgi:hypothetical protein
LQLPIRRFYQDTLSLAAITAEKRIGGFLQGEAEEQQDKLAKLASKGVPKSPFSKGPFLAKTIIYDHNL